MAGTWRCPSCGAHQAESGSCFVCNRSATSCATCVHFRRAVATGLGYCGLDRRREPLTGAEEKPCWTSANAQPAEGLFALPVLGSIPAAARGLVETPTR